MAVRADTAARALRCAAQLSDAQSRLVNSEAHNDALRAHFNCTMLRIRRVRSPTLLRRAPLGRLAYLSVSRRFCCLSPRLAGLTCAVPYTRGTASHAAPISRAAQLSPAPHVPRDPVRARPIRRRTVRAAQPRVHRRRGAAARGRRRVHPQASPADTRPCCAGYHVAADSRATCGTEPRTAMHRRPHPCGSAASPACRCGRWPKG